MDENLTEQQERIAAEDTQLPDEREETVELPDVTEIVEEAAPTEIAAEAPVKRKWRKILLAVFLVLLFMGGATAAVMKWGIPAYRYKQAEESFAAGEYVSARDIYRSLGDYKNSRDKFEEADNIIMYARAQEYFDNGEYEKAENIYERLGDYKDSKEKLAEASNMIIYDLAQQCYDDEAYYLAYELYDQLGDFLDAEAKSTTALHLDYAKSAYQMAEDYYRKGYLRNAYETLTEFAGADYRDTADRIKNLKSEMLDRALQHAEDGELRTAKWYMEYLASIGYEPAITEWDKTVKSQRIELDYSYYDLKDKPIGYFTPQTTPQEFSTVYLNMFLNGKKYFYLPARGVLENDMHITSQRINDGYSIAHECLPEYGTVYSN